MISSTTRFRSLILTCAATATLTLATGSIPAQTAPAAGQGNDSMTRSVTDSAPAPHSWTTDQIMTATVHQAWLLSGKDENNFFEMVKELAEISAKNRNMTLPDDPEAGKKAGAYIKKQAKADHDQLLFAIVDKSVRMTGTKGPTGN